MWMLKDSQGTIRFAVLIRVQLEVFGNLKPSVRTYLMMRSSGVYVT
jgi:hypothetical protein